MVTFVAKIDERIQSRIRNHVDATAIAAVTTVGTAARDILFAAKTGTAVTAVARFHLDNRFIYKFHWESLPNPQPKTAR